jgi:hypothetical protein
MVDFLLLKFFFKELIEARGVIVPDPEFIALLMFLLAIIF